MSKKNTKIEKLIEEFCPQGVELLTLGEVCEFKRGTTITKKSVIPGNVPVIAGGRKPAYYHNTPNRMGTTISISSSGAYAGFVNFWETPVFLSDSFSLTPKKEVLLPKYLYYFLKSKQTVIHETKSGGGVPHVYGKEVAKFKIPIPPLTIQKEIVKILDNFTQLEAELKVELEAELEARKKQYEYYRGQLLMVNDKGLMVDGTKVEFRALGEVCESIISGRNSSKSEVGLFPVYGSTGVIGYSDSYVYDKDYLLAARVGANAGYIHKATGKYDVSDNTLIIRPREEYDLSFAYFQLLNLNLNNIAVGGGQPLITAKKLKKLKIPIPPLAKQKEIVAILDKFDALVNDISIGLPAEITARKKQYEYYRNQLLSFKPLEAQDAS